MTRWALVTGSKGADKSATLRRVAAQLEARGVPVAGFFQESIEEGGARTGHSLRRLGHDEALPVVRRGSGPRGPNEESFCQIVFDHDAFAAARRWLTEDAPGAQALLLDEISKLEVAGKGHHDAVAEALGKGCLTVLSVRADQLFYVIERFGLDEPVASLEAGDEAAEEAFVEALARAAQETA
jgi:nucleoside-triphosphatase THEP1